MSTPAPGPEEKAALRAIVIRSALDLETHQMRCVLCRTPGVICGTGANIAATTADAERALGMTS
ncbi:hypothetical protein GCM10011583_31640 [Streptomyces camponoticapitis]|uniref:Uncharacterized protein n=1 Tax=Streptomyces camponoticapitis TaxID=1616125 RepID=A0ABQ2E6B3_9ACTN|nr:hypothetical protein [Streptomyces camponoticapitis]GGJ97829.1 hypothetical protein GCM10011583_31640 [Streptomyces camponoticapitis]